MATKQKNNQHYQRVTKSSYWLGLCNHCCHRFIDFIRPDWENHHEPDRSATSIDATAEVTSTLFIYMPIVVLMIPMLSVYILLCSLRMPASWFLACSMARKVNQWVSSLKRYKPVLKTGHWQNSGNSDQTGPKRIRAATTWTSPRYRKPPSDTVASQRFSDSYYRFK